MNAAGEHRADIAVVGASAAGLMAAIAAAEELRRHDPSLRGGVLAFDSAVRLGAKILVSGGGRCNVTHFEVTESDFWGGSPKAIAQVLRQFGVDQVRDFFAQQGVVLKREDTGKLFPTSDRARSVLDALLGAAEQAGARVVHPFRVETIRPDAGGFLLTGPGGTAWARRVILATGGRSLPKSGSDGHGYVLAGALGHTLTERILPALVPLLLVEGDPLRELSGISADVALEVRSPSGRRRVRIHGAMLLTHFGVSGPGVLDVSRHYLTAIEEEPGSTLHVAWLPGLDPGGVDSMWAAGGARTLLEVLAVHMPARLAGCLLGLAGADARTRADQTPREIRKALRRVLLEHPLAVVGPRGWNSAEVTAGGVPLDEVRLKTLGSRRCEGLHLCGELLDVDGRIGGFNFQWAWASGHVAGREAARALQRPHAPVPPGALDGA